ncbi:MAG: hypothetical protein NZ889_01710 [Candidatus Pacearchaeota archaeon]|nr:hypothetical protein [Candidatus Pacearchaeota archaeon]
MRKPKCYVLFSGGLDSRLALQLLKEQSQEKKFDVIAITFLLPFATPCKANSFFDFCRSKHVKQKIIDCTKGEFFKQYIKLVARPKFGYGAGMNPCIDCKIFMLKKVKKFLKDGDFVATGEVLGQRPMSQHYKALMVIEREAGLEKKVLRPLSAKLLRKTIPEEEGLVDREKLLDIQGRSRKKQIMLAKKYNINFPSPAGGCLLCEKIFAEKLKDLLKRKKPDEIMPRDIMLLRIGRHFFFEHFKIIVGRNHQENEILKILKNKDEKIFELKSKPGPSVLLQGEIREESIKKAKELVLQYSKHEDEVVEK